MATSNATYKNFKFNWCIENFQYSSEQLLQSTIISIPPFSGVLLCLQVKLLDPGNVKCLECYLQRIPCEAGPESIFINFKLIVSGTTVQTQSKTFRDAQFLNNDSSHNPRLKMIVDVFKFPCLKSELLVECQIKRKDIHTTGFYHTNSLTLSENMLALNSLRYFTDVTLCVQSHVFFTHKAILEARLPLVAKVLNINYETGSKIEVLGVSPPLMESLLHYAYSGCLVVENFMDMQELHNLARRLELLDLQRLINISSKKCLVRTSMNIQRKSFTWEMDPRHIWIKGHDMAAVIVSYDIGFYKTLGINWGVVEKGSNLFLEFRFQFPELLPDHPIFMNCTFKAMREDEIIYECRCHNLFSSNPAWSSGPLIPRRLLNANNFLMTLRIEIDLCEGEGRCFIEETEAEIVLPLPPCRNLERLSDDLRNLLVTGRLYDITLVTQQKLEIRCHRAILAARSVKFLSLIRQFTTPNNVLPVNGVSDEALINIVYYIYTGKNKDLTRTNVKEYNEAAKYFQIPH